MCVFLHFSVLISWISSCLWSRHLVLINQLPSTPTPHWVSLQMFYSSRQTLVLHCINRLTSESNTFFNSHLYSLRIEPTQNSFNNSYLYITFSTYREKNTLQLFLVSYQMAFEFLFELMPLWTSGCRCTRSAQPLPPSPLLCVTTLAVRHLSHFVSTLFLQGHNQ